uniref:Uncharacterized protein n=1 Tax=Anguilla anguilla TaxID=7936 RepID=A0A0E9XTK5_ANGAN
MRLFNHSHRHTVNILLYSFKILTQDALWKFLLNLHPSQLNYYYYFFTT